MTVRNKVVVVTGGAHGIGGALARRFAAERARMVVVADIDGQSAQKLAAAVGTDCPLPTKLGADGRLQRIGRISGARRFFWRRDMIARNRALRCNG